MKINIRAWDSDNQRMILAYEPEDQPKREYIPFELGVGFSHYDKSSLILMLSTGLRDATGKEVFEGDIISDGYDRYEIIWDDEAASFYKLPYQAENASEYRVGVRNTNRWFIVGNRYCGLIKDKDFNGVAQ